MKKKNIFLVIVSAILLAGVFLAGCTQDSGSVSQQSTGSQVASPDQPDQSAITRDRPAFNQSAAPNGTPLSGMTMNGTPPYGSPPEGMMRNRTPSGMIMNGTPPAGPPSADMMMNGTPPSGP